jgi:hypothetical protein
MFSNLSRGSILHGVDRESDMRWFTGSIESVMPSLIPQYQNNYRQFPNIDLDIVANIDGKQRTFKGIHGNDSIADFGENSIILADNKDSLYNYLKSLLKVSEDATNEDTLKKHRTWIPQYKDTLAEMMPGVVNSNEVKELREQVGSLQAQLAETLALLKEKTAK